MQPAGAPFADGWQETVSGAGGVVHTVADSGWASVPRVEVTDVRGDALPALPQSSAPTASPGGIC